MNNTGPCDIVARLAVKEPVGGSECRGSDATALSCDAGLLTCDAHFMELERVDYREKLG